jgi:UDP-glucose 6-dehydrogenase
LVRSFDPAVKYAALGPKLAAEVGWHASAADAIRDAEAVVICTPWPSFKSLPWTELTASMAAKRVIDSNRFLAKELQTLPGILYASVGVAL